MYVIIDHIIIILIILCMEIFKYDLITARFLS